MRFHANRMTLLSVALSASFVAFSPVRASCASTSQQPAEGQQSAADQDPISTLRLTPEQREQIRSIREQSKDERFSANQHLRQAQLALEQSLDFDDPGEGLIDQRIRDVAEAQAALMRIRVRTELKIRRVLTPEQLMTFHQLQQRARDQRRERQLQSPAGNRGFRPLPQKVPNQGNVLGPLSPRYRGVPRRKSK